MRVPLILGVMLASFALLGYASAGEVVEFDPKVRLLSPHTPSLLPGPLDERKAQTLYFRCDTKEQILAIVAAEDPFREYGKYNSRIGARKNVKICRHEFSALPGEVNIEAPPVALGVIEIKAGVYYDCWILELDNPKAASGKSFVLLGNYVVVRII